MSQTTHTYTLLRAFVDELVLCGMRAACTSPGSRSAPLALTLAGESRLRSYSHIDERCAAFFALGLAKASRVPVAVTCTSGTAVAELLPAAIEAREARVPLLLLSADRPAELRENGAGQAIDQLKIFGDAAKWFFEVELSEAHPEQLRWIRTLACRAYWTALEGRPGVVHLNFPLREPLIEQIEQTVRAHEAGDEARIVMKMNSLVDQKIIEALYRASMAGVPIALNVRGICCLLPGVPGVSETIEVVSVVGRFLEHSRVYSFHRGDEHVYYIGSADLMPRNLDKRVELLTPIERPELQAELEDTLQRCLHDDTYAWTQGPDNSWTRRDGRTRAVHTELMERTLALTAASAAS